MITLHTKHLAAAAHIAPCKDVRFYLNAVFLELSENGKVYIISIDGTKAFIGKVDVPQWLGEPVVAKLIIPIDTVIAATKTKEREITLKSLGDGQYVLGSVVFTPIDATYPDWRRLAQFEPGEDVCAQFVPQQLLDCSKALKIWEDGRAGFLAYVHARGTEQSYMTGNTDTAYCVLMPLNHSNQKKHEPFSLSE